MYRSFVVVPAVLALALGVAFGVAIANPVVPIKPATALEKKYLHLRAEYNFTRDLATVRAIDASNQVYYLGMPLSEAEKKQFRAQQRVGAYAGTVTDIVQKQEDFSGLWLENVGNGRIAVGLTHSPSAVAEGDSLQVTSAGADVMKNDVVITVLKRSMIPAAKK